ncbi:hypothetical protein JCM8208_004166 [Rhodotorula glutinis]
MPAMVTPKRERTLSPLDDDPNPPRTASRALHDAILLVSSSPGLETTGLDIRLLAILSEAVALTTALEDRELEHDRKRVKLEHASVEPAVALAPAQVAQAPPPAAQPADKTPMPSFWGLGAIQGELSDAEFDILHDIEASLPLLDKLGILLRPFKSHVDSKVSLLEWEALLPVKVADSNWRGAFFRPRVIFSDKYPSQPPSVKLASDFYHPNAYPSGTVLPCWPKPDVAAETWPAELAKPCEPFILSGQAETRGSRWVEFAKVPPHLRLPLYLETCRTVLTTERLEHAAQLPAYSLAKNEPVKYRQMVAVLADTLKPTSTDLAHLAEAAARAKWRTENGLDLPLEP